MIAFTVTAGCTHEQVLPPLCGSDIDTLPSVGTTAPTGLFVGLTHELVLLPLRGYHGLHPRLGYRHRYAIQSLRDSFI